MIKLITCLRAFFATVAFFGLQATAFGQEPVDLEKACGKIPYTVEQQQAVLGAYARISSDVSGFLPADFGDVSLDALKADVRSVIAGEAPQALQELRSNYSCRLKQVTPPEKHKTVDELMFAAELLTGMVFIRSNFEDISTLPTAYTILRAQILTIGSTLDENADNSKLTPAELDLAFGTPDFVSRSSTRTSIEFRVSSIAGAGVCKGAVQASTALVSAATIKALDNHAKFLKRLANPSMRIAAVGLMTDGQSVLNGGGEATVISSLNAVNAQDVQSCFQTVAQAAGELEDEEEVPVEGEGQ